MPDVELLWFYGYSSTCENPCGHETEADRCVCVCVSSGVFCSVVTASVSVVYQYSSQGRVKVD